MSKYTLVGINGNAFSVMGYVVASMKKEGRDEKEIEIYKKEAMSSDYDNLLCVSLDVIDSLNTGN